TAVTGATDSSANAPTRPVPITRSPTAIPVTSSPTSVTTPANSLPGTNGGGTTTWYRPPTIRTSVKFTAAATTRTRTSPAPVVGTGTSSTRTPPGGPSSEQIAASTTAGLQLAREEPVAQRALEELAGFGPRQLVGERPPARNFEARETTPAMLGELGF